MPAFENDKGWRLIALDDDHTTQQFVVLVFVGVLGIEPERAVELMLKVHTEGRAEVLKGSQEELQEKREKIAELNLAYQQNLFTILEKID